MWRQGRGGEPVALLCLWRQGTGGGVSLSFAAGGAVNAVGGAVNAAGKREQSQAGSSYAGRGRSRRGQRILSAERTSLSSLIMPLLARR